MGNRQNERLFEQNEAITSHSAALEAVLAQMRALIATSCVPDGVWRSEHS
jgi:hypothetical protein